MMPPADPERYKNHRFPGEIISHGVWLYYRFSLSYRDVEEILFERGITVTHEAIRQWCLKYGQDYAGCSAPASRDSHNRCEDKSAARCRRYGDGGA
jgi:putative transposase